MSLPCDVVAERPAHRADPSPEENRILVDAVASGDWSAYDRIVVAFSGGKDSLAAVLRLLELGAPREKLELWHHDIDGREGGRLFDWPVTPDYCRKVAAALGLPLRFSWKAGGFEGEMLRDGVPTAPTRFETVAGELGEVGGKGQPGTRMRFPQVSPDLSVRWCSAYLKIDVAARALSNDPAYRAGRFLFVTGERREESGARAKYREIERHKTSNSRRTVTQWRAVIDFGEAEVWELIKRWGVRAHPCYEVGFGRCSCAFCIFGGPRQMGTAAVLLPVQWKRLVAHEERFGTTMKRDRTLPVLVAGVEPYDGTQDAEAVRLCQSEIYDAEVLVGDAWRLPSGAFGDSTGPT